MRPPAGLPYKRKLRDTHFRTVPVRSPLLENVAQSDDTEGTVTYEARPGPSEGEAEPSVELLETPGSVRGVGHGNVRESGPERHSAGATDRLRFRLDSPDIRARTLYFLAVVQFGSRIRPVKREILRYA